MNTNIENIEKIKNWQEEIHEKIKGMELPGGYSSNFSPILDGIINIDSFLKIKKPKPKILWILKEAYDYDSATGEQGTGEWSLVEWLSKDKLDSKLIKNKTISTMAWISYSLLNNNFPKWNEINQTEEEAVKKGLSYTAYININKMPALANASSNDSDLEKIYYPHYRDIIHEQIKMIDPDVLIFGNTFYPQFKKDCEEKYDLKEDDKTKKYKEAWSYIDKNNKIYISAYHPSYIYRKGDNYANDIIQAVKERIEEREKQ